MIVDLHLEVEDEAVRDIPLQAKEMKDMETAMAEVPGNIHSNR
jgi:hypothetical protein